MSFMNWVYLSAVIDISCIVFFFSFVWKFRQIKKELSEIEDKLNEVIKNPIQAKRNLNKNNK